MTGGLPIVFVKGTPGFAAIGNMAATAAGPLPGYTLAAALLAGILVGCYLYLIPGATDTACRGLRPALPSG